MILLDQTDRRPIYEQIVEKLSDLMIKGILDKDTPLPSVRSMAADLSINPNTVQRAYNELDRLGYTYTVKGKGSFVAELSDIRSKRLELMTEELRSQIIDLKNAGISEEYLVNEIHSIFRQETNKGGIKNDRS